MQKLTRQHFKLIADAFNKTRPQGGQYKSQWLLDIEAIADALEQTNPGFDKERFIQACKGE
jgi:hypothetical protein